MGNFEYTVTTNRPFADVVETIEKKTVEMGFRVLHTHDIAVTLAEKGFPREPLKLIEICNANYASQVLRERHENLVDAALLDRCVCPKWEDAHQDAAAHINRTFLSKCWDRGRGSGGREGSAQDCGGSSLRLRRVDSRSLNGIPESATSADAEA